MTAKILEARRSADLYIATGTPVAASLVISICDQLDEAKESINALTLALEVERDAANLYAKQVAHWIGKHDALLEQQLQCVPQEWNDKNVLAWCVARGINAAQPVAQPEKLIGCVQHDCDECQARIAQPEQGEPLDRSDAVNLARNVIEKERYLPKAVTPKGVEILCNAVLRMDAALQSAQPVAQPLPLTYKQINDVCVDVHLKRDYNTNLEKFIAIARAVERAHGIGGAL